MTPETITGLNRLKSFFPDSFNVIGECLKSDVSIIRMVHLKQDSNNTSSLIQEVVRSSIRKLFQEKFGLILGYYDKKDDSISLNADIDRGRVACELSRQLGIDIKPDQIYIWIFFHEIGHFKSLDESGADAYANKRFKAWKKGS